ncbi:MAG: hypothetical protein R6V32_03725 [Bacteroidales bacterium]
MLIKKILTSLVLILMAVNISHAQKDTTRQHILFVNPVSPVYRTFSVSYMNEINDNAAITVNYRYRIEKNTDNTIILGIIVDDPYWYYNTHNAEIGYRWFYDGGEAYFEPALTYRYAWFKDRELIIWNRTGSAYDVSHDLDRNYHALMPYIKAGVLSRGDNFIFNGFAGAGYACRYYHDELIELEGGYPTTGDLETHYYFKHRFYVNIGFEIGFYLK